jgi:hypothetical protein
MKFFQGKKGKQKCNIFGPFSNKKGASVILMIVAVVVVTLIVFMTNSRALSYSKSDPILKEKIANDFMLMINSLMIPGDALVEYPKDLSEYNFILTSKKISVYLKNEVISNRVDVPFILPNGYDAIGDVEGKAKICLRKKAKNIFLEECK